MCIRARDPADDVRDIFVTALDTAPLAPSYSLFGSVFSKADYEAGVALLSLVTKGKIYVAYGSDYTDGMLRGAEMVEVSGPHPAGNAGVQAANISPVNKGETIWTLDLPTLGRIGRLSQGKGFEPCTFVAVTGPEVSTPGIVRTIIGAPINGIIGGRISDDGRNKRIISGNVLTGTAVGSSEDSYLRYPYRQITVIAEGDDVDEFMGWASISPSKMSSSTSFPGRFLRKAFRPDARLNGGRRAMIMSGEFDRVIPMDILPEYLLKAIIAKDIEQMEKLGIYEVAPEDFALAEYADTSKMPLQQIVRDGLEYIRKELS
ncbi:MAG: NADH:ubiquinone reductase (Na(+)-transporting) subunit A, partial [Muribaculaceae bacterium]|nr:NADH:ubiquinone reductase (Na(+)-transporting) subunit A [Muribaculaceae bacterium]